MIVYGATNIIVNGDIFLPIRAFFKRKGSIKTDGTGFDVVIIKPNPFFSFIDQLIGCMMCCSTWIGFMASLLIWSPGANILGTPQYASWFIDGLFASAAIWIADSIIERIRNGSSLN